MNTIKFGAAHHVTELHSERARSSTTSFMDKATCHKGDVMDLKSPSWSMTEAG